MAPLGNSGNGWPSWGWPLLAGFNTVFSDFLRLMNVDVQWDFPLRRDCLYKFI